VQEGDTLGGIADRAGVTVDVIVSLNQLSDADTIYPGTILRLPQGVDQSQAPPIQSHAQHVPLATPPGPAPAREGASATYVVQTGDTLYAIAQRFGTTPSAIVEANGLADPDTLDVGQRLAVPLASPQAAAPASTSAAPQAGASAGVVGRIADAGPATASLAPAAQAPPTIMRTIPSASTAAAPRGSDHGVTIASTGAGPVASLRRPTTGTAILNRGAAPAEVQIAMQLIGSPYEYGGDAPSGFDCSGFVQFVEAQAGRNVPRDVFGQYDAGSHPTGPLQPGDLVFFKDTYEQGLSHDGIYIGNGQFIHAVDENRGVAISSLSEDYYIDHWFGSTRLQ